MRNGFQKKIINKKQNHNQNQNNHLNKNIDNNNNDDRKSSNSNQVETNHNSNSKRILLFPGENYEFNEKLIHYDVFGFSNENLVSKKCSLINISNFIKYNSINL